MPKFPLPSWQMVIVSYFWALKANTNMKHNTLPRLWLIMFLSAQILQKAGKGLVDWTDKGENGRGEDLCIYCIKVVIIAPCTIWGHLTSLFVTGHLALLWNWLMLCVLLREEEWSRYVIYRYSCLVLISIGYVCCFQIVAYTGKSKEHHWKVSVIIIAMCNSCAKGLLVYEMCLEKYTCTPVSSS